MATKHEAPSLLMNARIDRDPVPYRSVGAYAFEAEHDWSVLLEDDEMEDAVDGIQADFDNCLMRLSGQRG